MFYATTCVGLWYGPHMDMLSGFSWEPDYLHCHLARGLGVLSRFDTPCGFACTASIYAV